ncbi:MAG TPA: DUF1573 domain-containing protein [Thermoanaerobaculia bacterium]|nr:DUF1573 domain-containing protein [Thermoanaerobaculia bacterium]
MFRRIYYAALAGVCAALALRAAAAPRLTLSERRLDLGVVAPWATATANVTIRNDGDETLHITHIETSCGCTTFDLDRKELPRGESARLVVSFLPVDVSGVVRNQLRITSDGGTVELQIEAKIDDAFGFGNGIIDLGESTTTSRVLPVSPSGVRSSEHVCAALSADRLSLEVWSETDGEERIVIEGDAPLAPVPLIVRWRRGDALIAQPERVILFGDAAAPLTAEVALRRRSGRELRIESIGGVDDRLHADYSDRKLRLRYTAGAGERSQRTITISAGDVRLEIPIVVMAE